MNHQYKHNLYRLFIIKVAHWFMLVMPIVVLFYTNNGLNLSKVFTLQAIYSISIVLWEIPSGYFADIYGRKNSLILGSVLGCLGFGVYSLSYSFAGFVVAEIILGIGQSLISGADSAILYDSLFESNNERNYLKYESRMTSIGNFAEAFAGILGGLIAGLNIRYPYYFQTGIAFIGIPAAITLIEPKLNQQQVKLGWREIIGIVKFSLVENQKLKWSIIYSSIIGASTLTMAWFVQPWFIRSEIPTSYFGVLWTILNLSVGITAFYAYRTELYLGRSSTAVLFTVLLGFGFILSGLVSAYIGLFILLLFYLARGVATPILKDYINRLTPSPMRATVLSVRNFLIRIVFALFGPIYGFITDKLSLTAALVIAGIVFFILTGTSFYFFRKSGNIN